MTIAAVEGDEIVIRVPITALAYDPDRRGFIVTDAAAFAPHVAKEICGEDMGERLWVDWLIEGAIIRAAEADAPGIKWDDASAEDQALHEAENDQSS
tara:strand:+ start:5410 stop:5700 length:291 start_codon:yes stop_codon:yes gene_type:complete